MSLSQTLVVKRLAATMAGATHCNNLASNTQRAFVRLLAPLFCALLLPAT
jgi:hypothetical protein